MHRISSNFTLLLKIFLPTFWISIFTLFTVAVFISSPDTLPVFHNPLFRWGWVVVYLGMIMLMYFTIMNLKRLELNDQSMLISNFFRNFQSGFDNVKSISISNYGLFKIATMTFVAPTKLGTSASFMLSGQRYKDFIQTYPDHILISSGRLKTI